MGHEDDELELWDPAIIDGKSRAELLELKLSVDATVQRIKSQIADAKSRAATTGEYSDPAWFHRANSAVAAHGRQSQRIQNAIAEAKKKENTERDERFEKRFIEAARSILPADTFARIIEIAQRTT